MDYFPHYQKVRLRRYMGANTSLAVDSSENIFSITLIAERTNTSLAIGSSENIFSITLIAKRANTSLAIGSCHPHGGANSVWISIF